MKLIGSIGVLTLLLLPPGRVLADRDSPFPDKGSGYLTFYLDNDLFGGNDENYTNGARLSWISEGRNVRELGSVQRFLRRMSGDAESFELFRRVTGFEDPEEVDYNFGFSLTQLMFTPEDPMPSSQPDGQRRYAGWVGIGFSLHAKDDSILNSIEFILGTTGSNSGAEHSQNWVHDLRGIQRFNGWDDQIPNEITGDLTFVQKRRPGFVELGSDGLGIDGLTEWGARLGSFRTEAHVGGFFRLGLHLPSDFSDPRLSSTAYSHRFFRESGSPERNWSFYTMFGATARGVAHDASLDGPLFRDFDTGNERVPFLGELFSGIGIRYGSGEFSYMHTWRSQEFRAQTGLANFGSVALRWNF